MTTYTLRLSVGIRSLDAHAKRYWLPEHPQLPATLQVATEHTFWWPRSRIRAGLTPQSGGLSSRNVRSSYTAIAPSANSNHRGWAMLLAGVGRIDGRWHNLLTFDG